jgi:hypothetical protein
VAAAQISELVEHLPANGPVPISIFDAGYDPEALARELAELDGERVAVLVRLRSDRQPSVPRWGDHGGTVRSSPAPMSGPGLRLPANIVNSTYSMAAYGFAPGRARTPKPRIISGALRSFK